MTWASVVPGSPWGVQTLPYGVAQRGPRIGVATRIGDYVVDLASAFRLLRPDLASLMEQDSLNAFMAAGRFVWEDVRETITDWLVDERHRATLEAHLHPLTEVTLRLPFTVGDYVDFYSSKHHAENLGAMFRPGQPALTSNWLHLPIGYHGRSGTVVVSGTDVRRPCGQRLDPGTGRPTFGPSLRLDIEAEVGFVVGVPSHHGHAVPASALADTVFGVVLVNDWSARDLQAWEYVPLGPFLGKSFATSVSAWVTPLAALQHARVNVPEREMELLPYLREGNDWGLDIDLSVELCGEEVSRPPFAALYWSAAHQLAHMTVNGASVRTGDLFASGTVSGSGVNQRGSLIEMSWNGTQPFTLGSGVSRSFLEDGDEVVLRGTAPGPGGCRVGIGEVRGRIAPAN